MSLTAAQQAAIAARGNVLVVAGAGTGKTRTLVERCLDCLLSEKPRASLDEILMVTFTEAAAAEMRQRIRERLEQQVERQPKDAHWPEQLALFETAHIGTLHSFCLQLVRQHFYQLELDPQLAVLAEEEAGLLAQETLETLLQKHYAGRGRAAEAVRQLIQAQGAGREQPIRALVLRLHHYAQTRPDPAGWMRGQLAMFAKPEPTQWLSWLEAALKHWTQGWLSALEADTAGNELADKCAAALTALTRTDLPWRAQAATALEKIRGVESECPRGKKALWLDPLEDLVEEAQFLFSLVRTGGQEGTTGWPPALRSDDPLEQDWNCTRGEMTTLLELAAEFTQAFTEAKHELGMVDFHDLEQFALRLLWDNEANQPTQTAQQWRRKLRFVFVDEYQDINAAQDKIIEALSRDGAQANRFLVGDVKQSIYRFRLANPYIFQGYVEQWGKDKGQAIPLVDNFRSREGILDFINSVFGALMRRDLGGVDYDEQTRLRFGAPKERHAVSSAADPAPRVELHLRLKGNAEAAEGNGEDTDALNEVRDLQEADKEARLVALRLRELKAQQHPIWDEGAGRFRPVEWSDMALLLRSPANKAESYAKEFSRLNIPLQARAGFYESLEISDLLSLLKLLDNPLQDVPALAVLHSPLVGLTLDELATIRLTVRKAQFWTALGRWEVAYSPQATVHRPQATVHSPRSAVHGPRSAVHGPQATDSPQATVHGPQATVHSPQSTGHGAHTEVIPAAEETHRKVAAFLERFARWRRFARQVSLSRCLEAVLTETHYADWLLTQPHGEQRHANVQRLLGLAQEFDQFQRQGLFRFLKFIEAQQQAETEPEVAAVSEENAVRLMSIHQSKGLEFPVVAVADLGKAFNLADLRADIILDEEYGLCPQVKPPHTGKSYPSLPYWLARRRQTRELLGEELRLLYVALTRARDTLLLSASISGKKFATLWSSGGPRRSMADEAPAASARSYADWLGLWFSQAAGLGAGGARQGENALLRWTLHDDDALIAREENTLEKPDGAATTDEPQIWQQLQQRLSWQYPFSAATRQPAKTSVSVLRRQATMEAEASSRLEGAESRGQRTEGRGRMAVGGGRATAVAVGNAHHKFLQLVALERTGSLDELKQEASRLEEEGTISAEEVAVVDFKALAAFWGSELGRKVREQADFVRRELVFTARFSPNELAEITGAPGEPSLENEFVVVQGAADLAVLRPEEIWLIDFKTDRVSPDELAGRAKNYEPQLRIYARALARIYRRPVSQCWLHFLAVQQSVAVEAK